MSHQYQLNWTDPQFKPQSLTVIPETKNTSTSIALFGHHYADFGSALNKNLMSLLENFASRGIEPTNPTIGQLWYDATVGALKICTTISNIGVASWKLVDFINGPSAPTQPDGSVWYDTTAKCLKYCVGGTWLVLGTRISASQPGSAAIGDLWFNTVEQRYSFWDGGRWVKLLAEETHVPLGVSRISLARQDYTDRISFSSNFPMVEPLVEFDEAKQSVRVTGKNVVLRIRSQLVVDSSKVYRFNIKLRRVSSTIPGGWPEETHIGTMPFNQTTNGVTDLPYTGVDYSWNAHLHPNLYGLRTDPTGVIEANVIVKGDSMLNNGGQFADLMLSIGTLPIYTNGQVDFNKVATFAAMADYVYLIESLDVEMLDVQRNAVEFDAHSDLRPRIRRLDGGTIRYDIAGDRVHVTGKDVRIEFDDLVPADKYRVVIGSVLIENIDCAGVFSIGAVALDDRLNPITIGGKSETLFVAKNANCAVGGITKMIGTLAGESSINFITDINNIPGARWLRPVVYLNQNSILDGECAINGFQFNRSVPHVFADSVTLSADPIGADEAATKRYVDTKVSKTGDVIDGFLSLNQTPLAGVHATNKNYVDGEIETLNGALSASIDTLQGAVNDLSARLNDAYQRIYDLESRLQPPA